MRWRTFWTGAGLVAAAVLGLAAFGALELSRSKTYQLFGEIIARVETDRPVVALTFDDGPTDDTNEVIAILAEKDVRATFFLIGEMIEANPQAARALVEAGHELGNHSFSHHRMWGMSPARVRAELDRTDAAIRGAGQAGPIPFRPPYGKKLVVLPWVLSREDRPTVMWSLEPESAGDLDAKALVEATVGPARAGDIILLHPMYASRAATRAALPAIIDGLRTKGLEPVSLATLLDAD